VERSLGMTRRTAQAAAESLGRTLHDVFLGPKETQLRLEWQQFSDCVLDLYNLTDQPGWEEPEIRAATLEALESYTVPQLSSSDGPARVS
jgi:hypothetical protein